MWNPYANPFMPPMGGIARLVPRLRPRRAFTRQFMPGAAVLRATPPVQQSAAIRCWGPSWDRSCKLCLPMPTPSYPGATHCTVWKPGLT